MATVKVKVLGICGSPFANGNSDMLLSKALEAAAEAGAETEKVYLFGGKRISPCNYCMSCQRNGGKCAVQDDMQPIYQKIIEADVIIHSNPIYFWCMPGQMKCYLDRWTSFFTPSWALRDELKGIMTKKVMACLAVGGDPDKEKNCSRSIGCFKDTADFVGMKWAGYVAASASEHGEIAKNLQSMQEAYDLGKKAVSMVSQQ